MLKFYSFLPVPLDMIWHTNRPIPFNEKDIEISNQPIENSWLGVIFSHKIKEQQLIFAESASLMRDPRYQINVDGNGCGCEKATETKLINKVDGRRSVSNWNWTRTFWDMFLRGDGEFEGDSDSISGAPACEHIKSLSLFWWDPSRWTYRYRFCCCAKTTVNASFSGRVSFRFFTKAIKRD